MTRFLTPLCALAATLAGCGHGDGRQAVSGTVTFKGRPVEGLIDFVPAGGEGTQAGTVIELGKYQIPRDKGLVPGTYKVMIFSPDPKAVTPGPGRLRRGETDSCPPRD